VLQGAIDDVRALAGSLRPPSLDELGLLPTIQWFCGSFERLHPNVVIDRDMDVEEDDTPLALKIVIYRVIESAVPIIASHPGRNQVRLDLRRSGDSIELQIEDTPRGSRYQAALAGDSGQRFAKIKERITLSGGTFVLHENAQSGMALRASWLLLSLDGSPYGEARALQRAAQRVSRVY
jgi:signal transduction histidine kinase